MHTHASMKLLGWTSLLALTLVGAVACSSEAGAGGSDPECTADGDCSSTLGNSPGGKSGTVGKPDDGKKNGDETDVDCGGAKAPKCEVGKGCSADDDCTSGACSYAKKCVEFPSCTRHFGGDTCGSGDTGEADANHESCCTTVTNSAGLKIGKYQVTAGRMRAFIERYNGNLQQWAATKPKGWNASWTSSLPSSLDEANEKLGPYGKRGCAIVESGARTYWQAGSGDEKNDFSQDVLDEKALNCVPWHMAQALCVSDGGRLPKKAELMAIITNDGDNEYPWQFHDDASYDPDAWDDRLVHNYSYHTPNPPADMRTEGEDPLDKSFFIAPPGRRPGGANKIGVQDAVGNMLPWLGDEPNLFAWTLSWEEHPLEEKTNRWPEQLTKLSQQERDSIREGYYAIGARCVFE